MTQTRNFQYHQPETARRHNAKVAKAFDTGVYQGFFPRVNVIDPSKIDLIRGADGMSSLITGEGVRVDEDADITQVVQILGAHLTFTRIDLVVGEYQFTNNPATPLIYKVIQGAIPTSLTQPYPIPEPANAYQVPICYVRVGPNAGPVVLTQTDLTQIPRGQYLNAPSEIGSLKPMIDPTNTKRLYVFGGTFYSRDGTAILNTRGSYSDVITDPGLGVTNYQYFLFDDAGNVTRGGTVATYETNPPVDSESTVIAVCEVKNTIGTEYINRVRDVRSGMVRAGQEGPEIDEYKDMLASTTFTQLVFDGLSNDNNVDFTTLDDGGLGAALTVEVDAADSSLTFSYVDNVAATGDVELVLGDFLSGASLSTPLTDFAVVAVHDIGTAQPSLQYDRSFISAVAGFTAVPRDLETNVVSTVENLLSTPAAMFIKLILPQALFPGTGGGATVTFKIFSIGLLFNTDPETSQLDQILDDGATAVTQGLRNAIGNPFQIWSKPNATAYASIDDNADFTMPVSSAAADVAGMINQFGPDGWMVMWDSGISVNPSLKRKRRGGGATDVPIFDMECSIPQAPATEVVPLEYRIPFYEIARGMPYSFALDFTVLTGAPAGRVGIQILRYKKLFTTTGLLASEGAGTSILYNTTASGRLVLSTDGVFNTSDSTYALGFRIVFAPDPAATALVRVGRPMAVAGNYVSDVPFVMPDDVLTKAAHYVSALNAKVYGYASDGQRVGIAVPHVRKHSALGTLRTTQVNITGSQNNSNIANISLVATENETDFSADSGAAGPFVIDSKLITEVLYDKV